MHSWVPINAPPPHLQKNPTRRGSYQSVGYLLWEVTRFPWEDGADPVKAFLPSRKRAGGVMSWRDTHLLKGFRTCDLLNGRQSQRLVWGWGCCCLGGKMSSCLCWIKDFLLRGLINHLITVVWKRFRRPCSRRGDWRRNLSPLSDMLSVKCEVIGV